MQWGHRNVYGLYDNNMSNKLSPLQLKVLDYKC